MSKQLTVAATAAIAAMTALALVAGFGGLDGERSDHLAAKAPLVGFSASR